MFYPSDIVVFCFSQSLSVFQDFSKDAERQVTTANDLMETRLNSLNEKYMSEILYHIFFGGGGHNTLWGTLSATRIVSEGTVFASGYCPGRHDPLADSVREDTFWGGGDSIRCDTGIV